MLTKDGRGVLFIHVPKTGGSSIENHFVDAGWRMTYHNGRVGKNSINHYRRCTPQHMQADLLQQNFRLDRFEAIFAVVRDPVARFRSEYTWRNGISGDGTVDPSADAVERWADETFATYEKNPYVHGNHIRPQVEYLVDRTEVFRFEDGLDAAMAQLDERYGLGLPDKVGRARISEHTSGVPSRAVEISPALEERLRQFYAMDFLEFGY